jgi:hypothetical protein
MIVHIEIFKNCPQACDRRDNRPPSDFSESCGETASQPASEAREHARPGRCWARPAPSGLVAWLWTPKRNYSVRTKFSARARKTAPGAGALPFLFRSSGLNHLVKIKRPDLRPAFVVTRFIRLHPGAQKCDGPLGDRCPDRVTSKTSLPTLNEQRKQKIRDI